MGHNSDVYLTAVMECEHSWNESGCEVMYTEWYIWAWDTQEQSVSLDGEATQEVYYTWSDRSRVNCV